ncbi:hypothetical protein [Aquabacterium humicola]|uniref:hypothetical protein n=1 Tax=Aquabacterium humicola TaxID=3237377 RepID=UPI0025427DAF|nr:hypothetical protein [Rubrivivax pictus]
MTSTRLTIAALAIGWACTPAHATSPATEATGLRPFSEASGSGVIAYNLGDRFHGPGVLTVGWMGSKKQVVLPAGEWIALAAVDERAPQGLELTTLVFGRFDGTRLRTLLSTTSNRRAAAGARWSDHDACAQPDPQLLQHAATPASAMRGECLRVQAVSAHALAGDTAAEQAARTLNRLGATAPAGPALTSTLHFAEPRHGFLRVQRIDWLPGAPTAAQTQALAAWIERYRIAASAGFRRDLDAEDLSPDDAPRPGKGPLEKLADVDLAALR